MISQFVCNVGVSTLHTTFSRLNDLFFWCAPSYGAPARSRERRAARMVTLSRAPACRCREMVACMCRQTDSLPVGIAPPVTQPTRVSLVSAQIRAPLVRGRIEACAHSPAGKAIPWYTLHTSQHATLVRFETRNDLHPPLVDARARASRERRSQAQNHTYTPNPAQKKTAFR